jgi:hypothetical protein
VESVEGAADGAAAEVSAVGGTGCPDGAGDAATMGAELGAVDTGPAPDVGEAETARDVPCMAVPCTSISDAGETAIIAAGVASSA